MYTCMYIYIYMNVRRHACMSYYVCMYACTYVYMHIRMRRPMCVYNACIYTYMACMNNLIICMYSCVNVFFLLTCAHICICIVWIQCLCMYAHLYVCAHVLYTYAHMYVWMCVGLRAIAYVWSLLFYVQQPLEPVVYLKSAALTAPVRRRCWRSALFGVGFFKFVLWRLTAAVRRS